MKDLIKGGIIGVIILHLIFVIATYIFAKKLPYLNGINLLWPIIFLVVIGFIIGILLSWIKRNKKK